MSVFYTLLFALSISLIPFFSHAQDLLPNCHEKWNEIEAQWGGEQHWAVKPIRAVTLRTTMIDGKPDPKRSDSLIFNARPYLDWKGGYDAGGGELFYYAETGGNLEYYSKAKRLMASFTLTGSLLNAPAYLDSFMTQTGVIPGRGRAYGSNGSYGGEYAEGFLNWSPGKHFNLEAGYGKHFWGDGYRSLFISDAANPYSYLNLEANVWKLKYSVLYAMHTDVTASGGMRDQFRRKYSASHFLSWNVAKKLNLTFFETVIWQGKDTNRTRYFDVNYLNPVIFFRPVEYSLGSSDNSMIGFGFRHRTCRYFHYYGQLLLDEFLLKEIRADLSEMIAPDDTIDSGWWANKYGWQLGWKAFDLFKVKGLFLQQEFSLVRPFTYAHGSVQQNYGHMNQSLAHPLGANFFELVNILSFSRGKWRFSGQINYAEKGLDTPSQNFGGNIFQSYVTREYEYGNVTGQGAHATIVNLGGKIGYQLIPKFDLWAEAGFRYRSAESVIASDKDAWVFLGLRTRLWNTYDDF